MKIWVTGSATGTHVDVFTERPEPSNFIRSLGYYVGDYTSIPRLGFRKLLLGTMAKLPRHASKTILELELEVKI